MLQESRHIVAEAAEALRARHRVKAQTLLGEALILDPENAEAWALRARLTETPDQQREYLRRAHKLDPADERVRVTLRALEHPGGEAAFYGLVGRAKACQQPQKAMAAWKAVLDFDPANEEALLALLPILEQARRQKLARALLVQALKRNPHNITLMVYYADLLAADGRWDNVAALLERVRLNRLNTAEALAMLGHLYLALGHMDEARAALAKAVDLPGADPLDHYHLGRLYERTGDDEGAIAAYQHIVDEAWGTPEASDAEKRLRALSPYLPRSVADSWAFILREAAGWALLVGLMAVFDSGLRIVGMRLSGVVAIALSVAGGVLWAIGGNIHGTLNLLGERPIDDEWRQMLRIMAGVLFVAALMLSLRNGLGNAAAYFAAGISGPR